MFRLNHIKKLINIKEKIFKIDNIVDENFKGVKNKVIYASISKKKCTCSFCKSKNTIKYGNIYSNIRFLKICGFDSRLKIKKQRYLCKDCNKTFSLNTNIYSEKSCIANSVKIAIKLALKKNISEKDIAYEFGVSPSTVNRIVANSYQAYKPNFNILPKYLCFDEFKSTKDTEGAMSFIYCDAKTSKIIDIVGDRKLNNLEKYFSRFSFNARNCVENIVIDMYSPYMLLVKKMFPNAKISIDRFHLIQLISRSFNRLRISIMNKFKNKDKRKYNKLKKYWKLLLKNSCDLSSKKFKQNRMFDFKFLSDENKVDILLSFNDELKEAYNIYQEILIAINNRNFNKFKKIIENYYYKVKSSYMKTTLKTFKKYLKYIENSLTYEFSNGVIEGINRSIKVQKHIAYGYKSFFNFRNRILIKANLIA